MNNVKTIQSELRTNKYLNDIYQDIAKPIQRINIIQLINDLDNYIITTDISIIQIDLIDECNNNILTKINRISKFFENFKDPLNEQSLLEPPSELYKEPSNELSKEPSMEIIKEPSMEIIKENEIKGIKEPSMELSKKPYLEFIHKESSGEPLPKKVPIKIISKELLREPSCESFKNYYPESPRDHSRDYYEDFHREYYQDPHRESSSRQYLPPKRFLQTPYDNMTSRISKNRRMSRETTEYKVRSKIRLLCFTNKTSTRYVNELPRYNSHYTRKDKNMLIARDIIEGRMFNAVCLDRNKCKRYESRTCMFIHGDIKKITDLKSQILRLII